MALTRASVETAGIEFASDQSARQPKVSNYNRDAATAIPVRVLRKCLFIHRDQSAFRTFLGHGSGTGRSSSLSRTVSRHDRCQAESRPSRAGATKWRPKCDPASRNRVTERRVFARVLLSVAMRMNRLPITKEPAQFFVWKSLLHQQHLLLGDEAVHRHPVQIHPRGQIICREIGGVMASRKLSVQERGHFLPEQVVNLQTH